MYVELRTTFAATMANLLGHVRRSAFVGTLAALSACGPQEPAKNPRFNLEKPSAATVRKVTLGGPEALPSVVIAELATKESVVHFGRNGKKGVLVARAGGKWAAGAVGVGAKEAVAEDAQLVEIAPAPEQRGPVALAAHGSGFVFAWATPVAAGHEIWAAVLDARGAPVGKPRSAGRTFEKVTWIQVVSSDTRPTTLLWETEEGNRPAVFSAAVPKSHESPGSLGSPTALTQGAIGWQVATGPAGTVFAWVDGEPGRVRVARLDERGIPSSPTALTTGATALADVQVTALADRFLVGWTDTSAGDHHIHVAHIDGQAKVLTPGAPILSPVGDQVLVNLLASEDNKRVLVAWEQNLGVARSPRKIQLSLLDAKGQLATPRSVLDFYATEGMPHIVADGAGFTALTLAPMVHQEEKNPEPLLLGPVYLRFGPQLAVRTAEPIRVAELKHQAIAMEGVPEFTQGLHCEKGLCSLLATGAGKPALMALVTLPVRPSKWRAPARRRPLDKPPHADRLTTLADVSEPIADVASAVLADGRTLVAWVTHSLGTVADGPAPATATLAFRFIDGGKPGPIQTLSKRAISVGGVDVLALEDGAVRGAVALIGWAGPANGSQVYASLIASDGSKKRQKTVTKTVRGKKKGGLPNEVYDVDVAPDGHGNFLFSWSDTRDGNPEIYVARVNPMLQKNKRDTRITQTKGASIEPQLVVSGNRVLLAYSDADDNGKADIFVTRLDDTNLTQKGKPTSVEVSAAHSRTPRWSGTPSALALSWIDEEAGETPSALRLVATDATGAPTTAVRRVRIDGDAKVTSRLVRCGAARCRGLLAGSDGKILSLAMFEAPRETGAPIAAAVKNQLGGGTLQDVLMVGPEGSLETVFFVHESAPGARVRVLHLRW